MARVLDLKMRWLKCLACMALVFATAQISMAQVNTDKLLRKIGLGKANTEFLPESAFAGAVVFPKVLKEDPKYDIFPREIVTAWGKKELGFDPMLITQATFVVKKMDGLAQPPVWAAVLHFEEMQGLAGGIIDQLEKKKIGDKVLFSGNNGMPSFLVFDESTMFVGEESFFEDMINAPKGTRLAGLIKGSSVEGEIQAFADIEAVRPLLNGLLGSLPGGLPPAVNKLTQIPDMVDAIELGVTVDGNLKTTLVIHAADEEQAEEANKIMKNALDLSLDMGIGLLASQMDFSDPVQEATVEYAQRAGEDYKERLSPDLSGRKMSISLNQEATLLPIAIGMILPAVQQVRHAARRTQSMNNVRQMTLAMHNFESAYKHFPAQASYDKNGKALLSWRVHILPFIDQNELYKQFRLDEPWDSPHNRKLIDKMPPVYRSPSSAVQNGKTVYLGISGKGTIFDGPNEISFRDISDGSSNTVMMVEANDALAVEWTKPQDFEADPRNPLRGLGQTNPGGFIVTMADGSSQFISNAIDPENWLNMLTIGDGNVIDR